MKRVSTGVVLAWAWLVVVSTGCGGGAAGAGGAGTEVVAADSDAAGGTAALKEAVEPELTTPDAVERQQAEATAEGGPAQEEVAGREAGQEAAITEEMAPVETVDDDAPGETPSAPGTDPGEPGPLAWTKTTAKLELPGGLLGTTIPLDLYVPDEPGIHPVVVFTHGFQLTPSQYASFAGHLASWGYVLVLPRMPGGITTHAKLREHLTAVLDWVEAQAAAAEGPLAGKADGGHIGLSGHSMGGKIALLVASGDARPKAAFLVDPVDAAGMPVVLVPSDYPSVTPELMPYVTIPLGFLGETTDASCSGFACQACAPADDNFQQYYLFAQTPSLAITALGAGHMSFLDDPDCGLVCSLCNDPSDDPASTRKLLRRYATAFFHLWLRGDASLLPYLTGASMDADVAAGLALVQHKHGFPVP